MGIVLSFVSFQFSLRYSSYLIERSIDRRSLKSFISLYDLEVLSLSGLNLFLTIKQRGALTIRTPRISSLTSVTLKSLLNKSLEQSTKRELSRELFINSNKRIQQLLTSFSFNRQSLSLNRKRKYQQLSSIQTLRKALRKK